MERKRCSQEIVKPFPLLRVSEHFESAARTLLEAARQSGLEGLIAKRTTSLYESRRSRDWLKIKADFATGVRHRRLHAGRARLLRLARASASTKTANCIYAGNVGTGFDEETSPNCGPDWSR